MVQLGKHKISINESELAQLEHTAGYMSSIIFRDGTRAAMKALYVKAPFEQHSAIPQTLGCELTEEGYIKVDALQETNISGVYACGDSTNKMRTVANAVATGTTAGMAASKKLIFEEF
jgi:thioredoxin reductase